MTDILLYGFFEDSTNLDGETGLSGTIDVYRITKSDLTSLLVVNNQAITEIGSGLYSYRMIGGDLETYDYVGVLKTASGNVVSKNVPVIRWDAAEAHDSELSNLDATVSSRATPADVSTSVAVSASDVESISENIVPVSAYYTLEQTITSTLADDLSAATKLWFAIKRDVDYDDDTSVIFIEQTAGLTRLNEEAYATVAHGSILVTGSVGSWSIAIKVEEQATSLLELFGTFNMELKALIGGDTVYISGGTSKVSKRQIRAIS